MKAPLIAAMVALSALALAPEAYAQRGDERTERGERGRRGGGDDDGNRPNRGDGRRGDGNRGDNGGGPPPVARPQPPAGGGGLLGGQPRGPRPDGDAQRGGDRGRGAWNGQGDRGRRQWNGDRGQAGRGDGERGRGQWNGDRGQGGRGDGDRGGRGGADGGREGGRGEWGGDRGRGDGNGGILNGGRDGRGQWNGDRGRGDGDRGRADWNGGRDGRDGRGDWNGRDRDRDGRISDGRGGRDWGRDGRRDWRDDDRHRQEWDRGRRDARYDRYRRTHRDFDRPRYNDWRHVRHGYYFDYGYSQIVYGYYGRRYYWWSYDGWHRPYRRWSVGYVIPSWLYWEPLPWDLYYRLPPAPYGCRYVYADGDILLVAIATGLILDALLYEDGYY